MWSVAIACPTAASPLSLSWTWRASVVVVVGAIAAVRGQMCYTYEYVVKWMRWRGERGRARRWMVGAAKGYAAAERASEQEGNG